MKYVLFFALFLNATNVSSTIRIAAKTKFSVASASEG